MTNLSTITRARTGGSDLGRFLRYVARRFKADDGLRVATALSYTSLLAIVPLVAISLAVLSAFPAFDQIRVDLMLDVYSSVLPETQIEIARHFEVLVANATRVTAFGAVGLAVTAVLLLSTIVQSLNRIWRVERERPFLLRFLVYWAILTVGPLLFGASFTVTNYVYRRLEETIEQTGITQYAGDIPFVAYVAPSLFETLGFAAIYLIVPNTKVRVTHALIGGGVTMGLFTILKNGFGLYVSNGDTYATVYGALAVIPITLIWLYMVWAVLILGAEITASIPEWREAKIGETRHSIGVQRRLTIALALLHRLADAHRDGQPIKHSLLIASAAAGPLTAGAVLRQLAESGFAVASERRRWVLGRDLSTATLYDLIAGLRLVFEPADLPPPHADTAYRPVLAELLGAGEEARRQAMATPLSLVLAEAADAQPEPDATSQESVSPPGPNNMAAQ